MNKLTRKRADFQKLRGTTKRINRLIKIIGRQSPERIKGLVEIELNVVEIRLKTIETVIVKESLTIFAADLRRLYTEAKNA